MFHNYPLERISADTNDGTHAKPICHGSRGRELRQSPLSPPVNSAKESLRW